MVAKKKATKAFCRHLEGAREDIVGQRSWEIPVHAPLAQLASYILR